MTTAIPPPLQVPQSISEFLSGIETPWDANYSVLSALLQFNLLWSAVFISAFYMLFATAVYYIPLLLRVPLLNTLTNLLWFVSCILYAILIYAGSSSVVIKGLGVIFLILCLTSFIGCFYSIGRMLVLYFHHQNLAVATRGPYVVTVNETAYSTCTPTVCVTVVCKNGICYFENNNLGSVDPLKLSIVSYNGKYKHELKADRNSPRNKVVNYNGEKSTITVYTPTEAEVKSV